MAWRVAKSLLVLRDTHKAAYPTSNVYAYGTIGDAAHAAQGSASDHNPWVADSAGQGVVRALDIMDRGGTLNLDGAANAIRLEAKRRGWTSGYIGYHDHIASPRTGWAFQFYYAGYERDHIHVSAPLEQAAYDSTAAWPITPASATQVDVTTGMEDDVSAFHTFTTRHPTTGAVQMWAMGPYGTSEKITTKDVFTSLQAVLAGGQIHEAHWTRVRQSGILARLGKPATASAVAGGDMDDADVERLIAAINAQPAKTVAAIKAAL